MPTLNTSEIQKRQGMLNAEWQIADGFLSRKFVFKDFLEAFAFMTKVALLAEKLNHHPNWENSFNKVNLRLTTHEMGGLTTLDFEMAQKIDELFSD